MGRRCIQAMHGANITLEVLRSWAGNELEDKWL